MASVVQLKADGARISPADVLATLKQQAEWAGVTLSQVRPPCDQSRMLPNLTRQSGDESARRKERERGSKRVRKAGAPSCSCLRC